MDNSDSQKARATTPIFLKMHALTRSNSGGLKFTYEYFMSESEAVGKFVSDMVLCYRAIY